MTTLTTDDAIEAAAIARYGSARVAITRQVVRDQPGRIDAGLWFVLSIDRGAGWEVVGRRRTKAELWAMVRAGCQTSTRPVGAR